jgi:hypothetical protein
MPKSATGAVEEKAGDPVGRGRGRPAKHREVTMVKFESAYARMAGLIAKARNSTITDYLLEVSRDRIEADYYAIMDEFDPRKRSRTGP